MPSPMAPPAAASPTTRCRSRRRRRLRHPHPLGHARCPPDRGGRRTGQPCADFGNGRPGRSRGGHRRHRARAGTRVTSPPTIVRGVAVIGAQVKDGQARMRPRACPRLRRRDRRTRLGLGPRQPRPSAARRRKARSIRAARPNMWTIAAGDEELGLVYLPLGNSAGRLLRLQPQRARKRICHLAGGRRRDHRQAASGTSRPSATMSGTTTSAARRR